MVENLYEMNIDCGRQGNIIGRFLATPEHMAKLIGKYLYFGEVLGKHSEISGELEEKEITLVTDNQEFLEMAKKLEVNLESGFNPFNYYTCDECGEPMNIDTDQCDECAADPRIDG